MDGGAWGFSGQPALGWREHAACRGHDPDWWSTASGSQVPARLVQEENNRRAIRICVRCPVREECEQFGWDTRSIGVILGGRQFSPRTHKDGRARSHSVTATCTWCQEPYARRWPNQRYCREQCKEQAAYYRHKDILVEATARG